MRNPLGTLKLAYHAVRLVRDPNRLNEVFEMVNSVSRPDILLEIGRKGAETPEGARALRERTRVRIDLPALLRLDPGTFGRAFADHMVRNHLDPAAFPVRVPANEAEWVQTHLYETHDLWHVAAGFETDVPGELALQAFYLAQIPSRLPPILITGGMLRLLFYDFDKRDRFMEALTRGWLLGKQARPLFGQPWNELWELPLADVRARLNIPTA